MARPHEDPIATLLLERRLITLEQLDAATLLAQQWGVSLGEAILARGFVRTQEYYRTIAQQYDLEFVDLLATPPDHALLDANQVDIYAQELILPYRQNDQTLVIAVTQPTPQTLLKVRKRYGPKIQLVVTSKFDILWSLQTIFETHYTEYALHALVSTDPINSARTVATKPQLFGIVALMTAGVVGLVLNPFVTLFVFNVLISVFFLGNFLLKGILSWAGSGRGGPDTKITAEDVEEMYNDELPVYTILVPMFREPQVLPILASALRNMDYPFAKLDIKLVLEASDTETINAAKALGLESVFEIIRVPPSMPQTKPKACNYALQFARGDFVVIYDAEDKPEPDQLKKVLSAFQKAGEQTVCIQARLNYYNANENWLTAMFTLDYSLWFDLMLPGLERLQLTIPLGGTSNHFRTAALRQLRAWDPYNVTEDADLGVRIAQKGYAVATVNSTTFEEANCRIGNWIRQRSRWLKGYMQTYLVHMRNPIELYRSVGGSAFWGFQFFIGGTVAAALFNPIFWLFFILGTFTHPSVFGSIFSGWVLYLSLASLLIGNAMFIYLSMLGPLKRRWYSLIPYAVTIPLYWVLMSIAAYKGLWQLIRNPFYWEKTQHGISNTTAAEVARALQTATS